MMTTLCSKKQTGTVATEGQSIACAGCRIDRRYICSFEKVKRLTLESRSVASVKRDLYHQALCGPKLYFYTNFLILKEVVTQ